MTKTKTKKTTHNENDIINNRLLNNVKLHNDTIQFFKDVNDTKIRVLKEIQDSKITHCKHCNIILNKSIKLKHCNFCSTCNISISTFKENIEYDNIKLMKLIKGYGPSSLQYYGTILDYCP